MSQILQDVQTRLQNLFSPGSNAVVSTTLLSIFSITFLSKCYTNYTAWLAMGPGGVPYNLLGWSLQSLVGLFLSNDLLSTKIYTNSKTIRQYGSLSQKRFIVGELKVREGETPRVPNFVAPQRQDGGGSGDNIRELQRLELEKIAKDNDQLVMIKTSRLEARGPALFLQPSLPLPPFASRTHGEIAHIHLEAEGSSHVTLSLADAKEVIEKGWGRRHKLSGAWVPVGYLFLYAPRSVDEVEVLGKILRAGVGFVGGGVEVK